MTVEKNGVEIPKNIFLEKNSLLSRCSHIETSRNKNSGHLKKAFESFYFMLDCHDSPYFQFIQAHIQQGVAGDLNTVFMLIEERYW